MAADRSKVIKVTGSLIALSFSGLVLFAMFGPEGCGPSEEEQKIVASLNRLEELIEKGGYVKKVTPHLDEDGSRDSVYGFEAEIVNEKGVPIGRLRSQRIEGFGMMKPRFLWFKEPGVVEDWPARPPQGDRRRGDGRGPRGGGGRPPGGGARPEGAPPPAPAQ